MKITSKGQVTIPRELREKYMIYPNTEIAFKEKDGKIFLEKIKNGSDKPGPFEKARGTATAGLSTDEIMKLTRG